LNEEGRILPQNSFAPPPPTKKKIFFFAGFFGVQYFLLARGAPTPHYGPAFAFETKNNNNQSVK
jgi:hypothetical protein